MVNNNVLRFKEFLHFQGSACGFSTGQTEIRRSLERQNVIVTPFTANTELQHLSAHLYERTSKRSFLMPTHESNDIHPSLIKKMNEANEIIALCDHNKEVFERSGVRRPVHKVRQGIDLNTFQYKKKTRGNNKFTRFLWLGQTSIRKGWDSIIDGFTKAFGDNKNVELYLKVSGIGQPELKRIGNNIIFDSRRFPLADLLTLYHMSHVFVSTSRGESTNLPCLEAMACGSICLGIPALGMKEFINEKTAIPLDYQMRDAFYGVKTSVPDVVLEDLVVKLRFTFKNYEEIYKNTKVSRKFLEKEYSIDLMAKKLKKIIWN